MKDIHFNLRKIDIEDPEVVINGMMLSECDLHLEIGQFPKISFRINLLAFVDQLSEESRFDLLHILEEVLEDEVS